MEGALARDGAVQVSALRAALGAGLLVLACGLVHHDVTVEAPFTVGGGPPTATTTIEAAALTAPLQASAGDLSKLSSVTMQSVHLVSDDSGDLSYLATTTLTLTAAGLPDVPLATLKAAPTAGQSDVALVVDGRDLKPYLANGGSITAALTYSARPVAARGLKLVLVIRGTL